MIPIAVFWHVQILGQVQSVICYIQCLQNDMICHNCTDDLSQLFIQRWMGTWLSSELEKVQAVRKRSGAPTSVTLFPAQIGSLTATSLQWPLINMGWPWPVLAMSALVHFSRRRKNLTWGTLYYLSIELSHNPEWCVSLLDNSLSWRGEQRIGLKNTGHWFDSGFPCSLIFDHCRMLNKGGPPI